MAGRRGKGAGKNHCGCPYLAGEVLPEDVPVEVVEHRLPAEELVCPACGTEMREIGKEVRRSLVMLPAQVKIREDWLALVYEELHRELVQRDVLHTDETTLKVLREPGKSAQNTRVYTR